MGDKMLRKTLKFIFSNWMLSDVLRNCMQQNFKNEKRRVKSYLSKNKKTLDYGSGSGCFCRLFHPKDYVGVDVDKTCIRHARKRYPKYTFLLFSKKIPAKDNTFDNVFSSGVFHHIPNNDFDSCLKEIQRVAKKDAKIIFMDQMPVKMQPNFIGRFIFQYDFGRFAKEPKLMRKFIEKHFDILEFHYLRSGHFKFQVWKLKKKVLKAKK